MWWRLGRLPPGRGRWRRVPLLLPLNEAEEQSEIQPGGGESASQGCAHATKRSDKARSRAVCCLLLAACCDGLLLAADCLLRLPAPCCDCGCGCWRVSAAQTYRKVIMRLLLGPTQLGAISEPPQVRPGVSTSEHRKQHESLPKARFQPKSAHVGLLGTADPNVCMRRNQ